MQAEGWECVAKQLRPPPNSCTKKHNTPLSTSYPPWWGGPHINKHLETFLIVDVGLLFFSKKVNLCQTYAGNTYVDQM